MRCIPNTIGTQTWMICFFPHALIQVFTRSLPKIVTKAGQREGPLLWGEAQALRRAFIGTKQTARATEHKRISAAICLKKNRGRKNYSNNFPKCKFISSFFIDSVTQFILGVFLSSIFLLLVY